MISIRNIIYEHLNNSELSSNLQMIIDKEKIPHTKNQNGTFINISLLEENHLLILDKYIKNIEKENENEINEELKPIEVEEKVTKKVIKKKEEKKIKLSSLEQKIVAFSL